MGDRGVEGELGDEREGRKSLGEGVGLDCLGALGKGGGAVGNGDGAGVEARAFVSKHIRGMMWIVSDGEGEGGALLRFSGAPLC